MAKPKLPDELRSRIRYLFRQGRSSEEVSKLVLKEAMDYVGSHEEVSRCVRAISKRVKVILRGDEPEIKSFDTGPFKKTIEQLKKDSPEKEIEGACTKIALHILTKHEGFKKMKQGPPFRGTPFDFFGFKDGDPYIVELKASLENFNSPGEVQKRRMQALWNRIKDLNIALLQVKLRKGEYRMLYNKQLERLFYGPRMPLEQVERWIKDRL